MPDETLGTEAAGFTDDGWTLPGMPEAPAAVMGVTIPEAQLLARIAEARSWAERYLEPGLAGPLLALLDGGAKASPTRTPREASS